LFKSLAVPDAASIRGRYRAACAGPALALTGLRGWWGKEFHADGTAVNLLRRGGELVPRFPMIVVRAGSMIDRQDGLALHYRRGSPFPWMFVVDELRRLDDTALLGMTVPNAGGLRRLAFPFLLQRQAEHGL
jgi:hypothetical protein